MIKKAEDQDGKHRRGQAWSPRGSRLSGETEGKRKKKKKGCEKAKLGNAKDSILTHTVSCFSLISKNGATGEMRSMFAARDAKKTESRTHLFAVNSVGGDII